MKYFVDNDGIHLIFDEPIPDNEAVESVKHVAALANNYQCDCAACREKRRKVQPEIRMQPITVNQYD